MKTLLLIQLSVALAVGTLLLIGDRSRPTITLASDRIAVTDAIVLRFDRPVDHASLERQFRLAGEATVAGSFQWSPRSVAFLPNRPLRYGASYTLQVPDLLDRQGRHLRKPFVRTIRTTPPRFLYLTPERALMLYRVDERRAVQVSRLDQRVLDFAIAPDGRTVFYSSYDAQDPGVFGLAAATLDWRGVARRRELGPQGGRRAFRVQVCARGLTALLYEDGAGRPSSGGARLLAMPIDRDRLALDRARSVLTSDAIAAAAGFPLSLVCSSHSDRFLYSDAQRQILVGSLGDPTVASPLGIVPQVYGFSPDDTILLGQQQDGTHSSAASLLMIDPVAGTVTTIGDAELDLFDPAFTSDAAWLAVAEGPSAQGSTARTGTICLLRAGDDIRAQRCLAEAPSNEWDEQPAWAGDDRSLAFVRQTGVSGATPALSTRGRLLGGTIFLATVTPGDGNAPSASAPVDLGVVGGQVTWLP